MPDIGKLGLKKETGSIGDAKRYYEIAEEYLDRKDFEKAIENYNMAILLNPVFAEAYFGRALTYYKLKEYDKAIQDYTKVMELDPKNPVVYNNRGDAYYRKGDFGTAIKDYDKAIMLNPSYMKAYYNRGLCYASLEQYDKAIEDFSEVIKLRPDFAEAWHLRGLAKEYNDDIEGAIEDYKKALELKPDFLEAKAHLEAAKTKKEQTTSGEDAEKKGGDIKLVERPKMTFNDVAGMEKVKEVIRRAIVYPLQDPSLAQEYGKKGGGGVLMYGPPGCGKTYIVKAAAGEVGCAFINAKLSDLLDMYVGNTEKNIHKVFELARKNAPTILFFDEVDAIGGRRGEGDQSQAMRMAVNQLLYEMDGIEANNENVLVLAATNAPWDVDPALRRSGRFTKSVYIPEPDLKSRMAIFKLHAKKIQKIEKNIAWFRLALATTGYSASDIKAIVEEAAEIPWVEAKTKGYRRAVNTNDFIKAIWNRKSSLSPWYGQAKKQIGKQEEVSWIDGKKTVRVIESKLGPAEREQFEPLIKEINKRSGILFKIQTTVIKYLALLLPIPF